MSPVKTRLKSPFPPSEIFPQNENFVKSVIARQTFLSGKKFEVVNFQLLTMIFSENFLFLEIFLEWKWPNLPEAICYNLDDYTIFCYIKTNGRLHD
jgi:hypothetical protein